MEFNTFIKIDKELELRSFEERDAREIFEAVKANYEHLRPFLHWVTPEYSLDHAKEFIERTQKSLAEKTNQTFGMFFGDKLIGAIGFVIFNWSSRRTEIGYWIDKGFEGQGIITGCCQHLVDYAFDTLEMNRIEIHCATENIRSRAVPERLGFKLEGILRQSEWRHTRFYDMAIYAMLAEERKTVNR